MANKIDIPKQLADSINSYLLSHQRINPSQMSINDLVNAVNRLRMCTYRAREAAAYRFTYKPAPRTDRKLYRLMGKLLMMLTTAGCNAVTVKDSTGNYHTYTNQ
jgi:hypothetical protein